MKKIYLVRRTIKKEYSDDSYYFGKKVAMRRYKSNCEAASDGYMDAETVELWRCIDMHDGLIAPVDLICSEEF